MRINNLAPWTVGALLATTIVAAAVAGLRAEPRPEPPAPAATSSVSEATALQQLATRAYVWGYPLTHNLATLQGIVRGALPTLRDVTLNQFSHARALMSAADKFVSPNVDVLFSLAVVDLRDGPMVLSVPDAGARYYVLQFVDPWTNSFAYVGRRATGNRAGEYLIAEVGYQGPVPQGMKLIHSPSSLIAIVGRVAVDDEHDLSGVHALQDGFALRPLHPGMQSASLPAEVFPQSDPRVPADLRYWEALRVALAAYPPPAAEAGWLLQLASLGLTEKTSPYVDAGPELTAVLEEGQQVGSAEIEESVKGDKKTVNGWGSIIHLFDYNLDYFEIGTLNEPQWKIADRDAAHRTRATAARVGLWGNHGYEAAFFQVWMDADGNALTGAHQYEWSLPKAPPAKAFWSLTMYDAPQFHLVANPINRYCIGSITSGLKYNPDGSLTIYIQKDNPGPDKESNWLPTPEGAFRPALSIFDPDDRALDPGYALPPIKRVD